MDTGEAANDEYIANLRKALDEHKTGIQEIILTHWHPDHIGGVSDICKHVTKGQCCHSLGFLPGSWFFLSDLIMLLYIIYSMLYYNL